MSRTIRIGLVSIITLAALGVFVVTLVHSVWYVPEDNSLTLASSTPVAKPSAPAEKPARLIISSLNINAAVQDVGVNAAGNMGVPNNFTDVAWYKAGPEPGAPGSAVIDGHVDNGLGLDGVFKHLADIKVGDEIEVDSASGAKLHFAVSNISEYPYHEVPTVNIFTTSGPPTLTLITCEGVWVQSDKTYDHRLVVTATLEQS